MVTDVLLTSADPEPPRRTFVVDDTGCMWWRTDADGIDNRSANWCTVEHGCASGSDWHDHESWTKVAGNYGPARVVEGTLDDIEGFLAKPDMALLRDAVEEAGAATVFARLAEASAATPAVDWEAH
jgi:hypothetical protein